MLDLHNSNRNNERKISRSSFDSEDSCHNLNETMRDEGQAVASANSQNLSVTHSGIDMEGFLKGSADHPSTLNVEVVEQYPQY